MDKQSVMAIVRAVAQGVGGSLVAVGALGQNDVQTWAGSVVMIASVIWSIAQKKGKVTA